MDEKVPTRINFRQKEPFGWNLFSLSIDNEYNEKHEDDEFMKMFLQNVILRDSCYNCYFKDLHRNSDITLADFWGIDNVIPEMNDDKGTSLVIVNSKKGNELIKKIIYDVEMKEVDLNEAIKYNPSMTTSVQINKNREKFFTDLENTEFNKLVKKYEYHNSIINKARSKVKKIIKKIIKNSIEVN